MGAHKPFMTFQKNYKASTMKLAFKTRKKLFLDICFQQYRLGKLIRLILVAAFRKTRQRKLFIAYVTCVASMQRTPAMRT